jgi:hypothetical protein
MHSFLHRIRVLVDWDMSVGEGIMFVYFVLRPTQNFSLRWKYTKKVMFYNYDGFFSGLMSVIFPDSLSTTGIRDNYNG